MRSRNRVADFPAGSLYRCEEGKSQEIRVQRTSGLEDRQRRHRFYMYTLRNAIVRLLNYKSETSIIN